MKMRLQFRQAPLFLAALISGAAAADMLPKLIEKLPPPAFHSTKSLPALEYCVGTGISRWLNISTLNGEDTVLIMAGEGYTGSHLAMLVKINDEGDRRDIAFVTSPGSWQGKVEGVVRACL